MISKYTFHKIFIKISQKLRLVAVWTYIHPGTGTDILHPLYDSTTTNTPPNTSYTAPHRPTEGGINIQNEGDQEFLNYVSMICMNIQN